MAVHTEDFHNVTLESLILVKELVDLKKKIVQVMHKYNVTQLDQIEELIANGMVPEHPTYEEYLAALSLQRTIAALKLRTMDLIEDI
jgi:hypothetical protein